MGRRQPLVLSSTLHALNSLLRSQQFSHASSLPLELKAGLLLLPKHPSNQQQEIYGEEIPAELEQLWCTQSGQQHLDYASLVGLPAATLRQLCVRSGSWVFVTHTQTNVGRPARVVVLDPPGFLRKKTSREVPQDMGKLAFPVYTFLSQDSTDPNLDVAYISPLLAFNLGLHIAWMPSRIPCHCQLQQNSCLEPLSLERHDPFTTVKVVPLTSVLELSSKRGIQKLASEPNKVSDENMLEYASHLRISYVRSPVTILSQSGNDSSSSMSEERQDAVDSALQAYFACDRLLTRGDVFYVTIESSEFVNSSETPCEGRSDIFFKVIAVEPSREGFFYVNRNYTALVLGGSVSCQLPPPLMIEPWERVPPLMLASACRLAHLLATFLDPITPSLKWRTAVLIHGPAGCGKRTVVRQVAKEFGVHTLEYNCYDLIGASDGKTVSALVQAFEVARRYSPSILLLRRFGALGKASRVATTLKESILTNLNLKDVDNENFLSEKSPKQNLFTAERPRFASSFVLVVATCENIEDLAPPLLGCFSHEFTIETPDENQRLDILSRYLRSGNHIAKMTSEVDNNEKDDFEKALRSIASQTSGLVSRDLRAIAADAGASTIARLLEKEQVHAIQPSCYQPDDKKQQGKSSAVEISGENVIDKNKGSHGREKTEHDSFHSVARSAEISAKVLEAAFGRTRLRTASAIGTPKVPNVKWEDVGGLEDVKKAILDTVQLPLLHRELFTSGLRQRSGVLLYGPPGTGKTLLAKAVATECSLNFLSVKGPELINMYIGESEKNVREIFSKARAARPCVIFFDELDALAPARGASGDSGGVMDRVVSQMLAEIDGISENSKDLFIIGASNRPDLIDPALMRPGRFDKLLYVGISADLSYRLRVLEALTRKFQLDGNVSLKALAQKCPPIFTGADLYALCADAWHRAVKRMVSTVDQLSGTKDTEEDIVIVRQEDFLEALKELPSSLSRAELERYEQIRAQFEGPPLASTSSRGLLIYPASSMNDLD